MKKIKLVLKATLFCLAAALSMGLAQAGTGTTNLLLNWSFEQPATGKISTGYDTVPYWFSDAIAFDSGVESGEVPPDGSTWSAYMDATNIDVRANQTTSHLIQPGECFIASIWCKNEWVFTLNYAHTNGYLSVMLYYGGTPDTVSGDVNTSLGTVGTPFFTNTFVIPPGSASHTTESDWTNYSFGVIADSIPADAIGKPIGIQFWNSSTQYNTSVWGQHAWMSMDDVQLFATNGIAPILSPVVLTPTNSVWGGETLTFSESAFGSTPLSYQWQTDGGSGGTLTNIIGATLTNLVVVTSTNPGTYSYQVIVSNSFGSGISAVVSYVVMGLNAPAITQDTGQADFGANTNLLGFIGGNVYFYAAFIGAPTVTNQWLFGTNSLGITNKIANATNDLQIVNVQPSSVGYYELTATNGIGGSSSTPSYLTALADPAAPGSTGVTNMYANDVMTNHPWAYWKFEETNDTFFQIMQAYDYSGHNFDATYGNNDGTSSSGCKDGGETLPDLGPIGTGSNPYAGFPANNMCAKPSPNHAHGYLRLPPLNLKTNTVTFTMWIKPNVATLPKSTGLLMNRNGGDAAGIGFGTTVNAGSTPCLAYTWNNNSSATYGWNSGLFPVAGIWNFVACTITPSNTVMYLYNASSGGTNLNKGVQNLTNTPEAFNGGTTWLAGDNWNDGLTFNGWIDEVAIFTNSLGENLIQDLFLKALGLTNGIPPTVYQQPTNTAVFQGQTLQLSALASGIPTPATNSQYQWQRISGTAWVNFATTTGRMTTNATMYWQYFNGSVTNFRAMAYNSSGTNYSLGATVAYVPCPTNEGLWTVNFCVPSIANTGPGTPYVGPGVLASTNTTAYWNTLSGVNMQNITGLLDDGITRSGIKVSATNGNLVTFSSGAPCNNLLLDQYCQITDTNNGLNFFFTQVPKGIYNMALYGCTASYANRGVGFTVITNGVSAGTQWVTNNTENAQDLFFTPYDNTVVFTNLLVVNGKLQVNAAIALSTPAYTNGSSTEADFNGAQLQLVTAGPDFWSCYNKGTNVVLTWGGGGLQQSTNLTPGVGLGWVTNTAVSPYTFAPTGAVRFFRIVNGAAHWP